MITAYASPSRVSALRRHWLSAFIVWTFFTLTVEGIGSRGFPEVANFIADVLIVGMFFWCSYRRCGIGWLLCMVMWGLPLEAYIRWTCEHSYPVPLWFKAFSSLGIAYFWICSLRLYVLYSTLRGFDPNKRSTFSPTERKIRNEWLIVLWGRVLYSAVAPCVPFLHRVYGADLVAWWLLATLLTTFAYVKRGRWLLLIFIFGWPICVLVLLILLLPNFALWMTWDQIWTSWGYTGVINGVLWFYSIKLYEINRGRQQPDSPPLAAWMDG